MMRVNSFMRALRTCIARLIVFLFVMLAMETFADDVIEVSVIPPEDQLTTLLKSVPITPRKQMPKLVLELELAGKQQVKPVFEAMLARKLYTRKSDGLLVIAEKQQEKGADLLIYHALSGSALGAEPKKALKKIKLNNRLRISLRAAIARLNLSSPDKKNRLAAVKEIIGTVTSETAPVLLEAREQEQDKEIRDLIGVALAIDKLNSKDASERLNALEELDGNLEPVVRNQLKLMVKRDGTGRFVEKDEKVREKAEVVLKTINSKVELYGIIEQVFFGISLGSVLLLVAIGLAITFGVMGVINMAHGELIMLGAYTTYVVQLLMPNAIEYSLFVAIPAAFLVSGFVGILIERGVIRFLKGRPLETLLATFGISLILQQAVRSVFSPLNRAVESPTWMSGSLEFNAVFSLTYNRLYILLFSLLVFAALLLIMKKTRLGLSVRAVSQNRDMAKAMGIRSEWVDAMTFGLGSGIAGIAGVALSQLTNVGPNLGQSYIIDSFMVVVFGGAGNLWGTLVGGFSLGIFNKFLEPATGAVLANIIMLVFIILFIQKRPRGLFPQKGRAAE